MSVYSMEFAAKSPTSMSLPWKTRVSLWAADNILINLLIRKDGTVNRGLLNLIDFRSPPPSKRIDCVKMYDVVVDETRKLSFRIFVPTQYALEDLPVMVYFHGGGYAVFSPNGRYDDLCVKFARELPAIVVSVDYPLAPEHRHPTQHEYGLDVLKFLDIKENRSKWLPENADITHCFLAGDSAGANMTHHVAQRASQLNFQQIQVIGLVAIQPFFGGEKRTDSEIRLDGLVPFLSLKRTDSLWNAFMPLGESHNRDHPIINVSGPNAVDVSKIDLPPTIVVVSGFDILRDWQIRYYQWLKKSGKEAYLVDYTNTFHGFYLFPELPEYDQLILNVKGFFHKILYKI